VKIQLLRAQKRKDGALARKLQWAPLLLEVSPLQLLLQLSPFAVFAFIAVQALQHSLVAGCFLQMW
jgi:hypothetical protein